MFGWIRKYWRSLSAAAFVTAPHLVAGIIWAWGGIKWVWDWGGRIDLVSSHLHDFKGLEPVITFFTSPPPWTVFPSVIIAALVVLLDVRSQASKAAAETGASPAVNPDPYPTLRAGFYSFCAAIGISIWVLAWPTMFPNGLSIKTVETAKPSATKPKLASNMARTIFVCDSPHLEMSPSLAERKAQLADRLDTMHRIFGVAATGDVAENELTLSAAINTAMGPMKQDLLAKRSGDQIFVSIINQLQSSNGLGLIWALGSLAPLDPEEDFAKQTREKVEQLLGVQPGKCKLV